jgi:hypothetical protein
MRHTRKLERGALATAVAYTALMVALPFIGDESDAVAVPFTLWIGGSVAAGAVVRRRSMLWIPPLVFVILLAVLALGLSNSEFFSDPLSGLALGMLGLGQLAGLLAGWLVATLWRRLRLKSGRS